MKIKSKTNLKQKQGISLIVLIITIIVMIILAAAVIISLSNNGIIDKANEAVDVTDEKQMQILAQTLWAEAYMDDKRDAELVTAVELGLQAVDPNYKSKYIVDITNTGVNLYKAEWETLYTGDTYTQEGMLVVSEDKAIFDRDSKYRITVESDYYTGTFETEYIINSYEGSYLFAILQQGNTVKYLTPAEFYGLSIGDEQYNPVEYAGIMIGSINDVTMSMIVCTNMADMNNYDVKITKIEKLKNYKIDDADKVNEYGFLYNTWYRESTELLSVEFYYYYYLCPNNLLYFRSSSKGEDSTSGPTFPGKWTIDENGNIVISVKLEENSTFGGTYTIDGVDILTTYYDDDDFETAINIGKDYEITRGTTGVYNVGIYKAKDLVAYKSYATNKYEYTFDEGVNVSLATISVDESNNIGRSFMTTDGKIISNVLGNDSEEFSSDNYTVSSNGKTIVEKYGEIEIEYELVEGIYNLE